MNIGNTKLLELIYLFADGETTTQEASLLFNAISDKPELQQELYMAMRMKNSVANELDSIVIPDSLEENLFKKAGFGSPLTPNNTLSSNNIFPVVINFVLVPLISALVGGLAVYYLMSKVNDNFISGNKNNTAQKLNGKEEHLNYKNKLQVGAGKNPGDIELVPTLPHLKRHNGIKHNSIPIAENNSNINIANLQPVVNSIYALDIPQTQEISYLYGTDFSRTKSIIYSKKDETTNYDSEDTSYGTDLLKNFSIELSGYGNVKLYPQRELEGNTDAFNNLGLSIYYKIGNNQKIGLEIGEETFPIFVSNGATLQYHPSIKWTGISYNYLFTDLISGYINPFTKIFVGGNYENPILKGTVGLYWKPYDNMVLSLGFETTDVFYYYQNEWKSGQKIGIRYGLEISY